MRKPEQRLWDRLRQGLNGQCYLERVENVVNPGRPDVDAMVNGITIPLELKSIEAWPQRKSTPVLGKKNGLNKNQLNWWLRWRWFGGRGFIVVSVHDESFAISSDLSDQINSFTRAHFESRRVTWAEFVVQIKREASQVAKDLNAY